MTIAIKAPAKYVQGPGELKNLGLNSKKLGSRFLVLCSRRCREQLGSAITESFAAVEKEVVFSLFHGQATKEEVFSKMEEVKAGGCDAVVGVGGGKAIDTAKAVCENLGGLPCIIVPTVASNDAPCSGVAVLYNDRGIVVKALLTRRNPDLVVVDTDLIAHSPPRLFAAGLGDALATWYEARSCQRSGARTMARGQATQTALMMARLCRDVVLSDGAAALADVAAGRVTPALERTVEATILLSGVGFESGGLAAAHAVNDALALDGRTQGMYHGEKVAFGTLVQLVLEGEPEEDLEAVLAFLKKTGLPMTLAQLGIASVDAGTLRAVAEAAVVPTQSTKNLSPEITAQTVYDAILRADRLGSAYRAG